VIAPAGASDLDVGIDSVEEVEDAVEEVLAEVPVIEELVEETLADVDDLEIDENADIVVEFEASDGSTVEIPDEADEPLVLESTDGETTEIELPGNGDDAHVGDDGSVVYEDAAPDTDLLVQAQEEGGVRVITVIDGAGAPTQFAFGVDVTPTTFMTVSDDGGVVIFDPETGHLDVVPAPWAYDANGDEVPSWYTIANNSVILNVDHRAVEAYPVVADPCWSCIVTGATTFFLGASVLGFLCGTGQAPLCGLAAYVGAGSLGVGAHETVRTGSPWPLLCSLFDGAAGVGSATYGVINALLDVMDGVFGSVGISLSIPRASSVFRSCR